MSPRPTSLALVLGLVAAACSSANGFGYREQACDPDERLPELVANWACARDGGCDQNDGHVVIDCSRTQNELEALAFEFPAHAPTLMANAVVAYETGDPDKAIHYLDALFAVQDMNAEAAILRSRIAAERGNLPFAVRLIERQVRYQPDHADLREALAAALYMDGEYREARGALDVAERLGAPAWRVAFHRGLIAESAGETREAERHYQDALRENPEAENAASRLLGLRAVNDATTGSLDGSRGRRHARSTGERGRPGFATLSGQ